MRFSGEAGSFAVSYVLEHIEVKDPTQSNYPSKPPSMCRNQSLRQTSDIVVLPGLKMVDFRRSSVTSKSSCLL